MHVLKSRFGRSIATVGFVGISLALIISANAESHESGSLATYNDAGELIRIDGWREWVHIGAVVTPNALNDGAAPFPEYHVVYMDPDSWAHYKATGEFRDGTVIAKELSMLYSEDPEEDGSTYQVSGRGFFQGGAFSGLEYAIKDSERYADEPGYWAYFSSGHAPGVEYPATLAAQPAESCNACHESSAGDDWVFSQFYPILSSAKPEQD